MIIQLDNYGRFLRCFTSTEAAKEYYSKGYASHECDILKCKYDEEGQEYIMILRYHNTTDEFIETYTFINVVPIV